MNKSLSGTRTRPGARGAANKKPKMHEEHEEHFLVGFIKKRSLVLVLVQQEQTCQSSEIFMLAFHCGLR